MALKNDSPGSSRQSHERARVESFYTFFFSLFLVMAGAKHLDKMGKNDVKNNLYEMIDYASSFDLKRRLEELNPGKDISSKLDSNQITTITSTSSNDTSGLGLEDIDFDEDIMPDELKDPESPIRSTQTLPDSKFRYILPVISPIKQSPPKAKSNNKCNIVIDLTDSCEPKTRKNDITTHKISPIISNDSQPKVIPTINIDDDSEEYEFDDSLDWIANEAFASQPCSSGIVNVDDDQDDSPPPQIVSSSYFKPSTSNSNNYNSSNTYTNNAASYSNSNNYPQSNGFSTASNYNNSTSYSYSNDYGTSTSYSNTNSGYVPPPDPEMLEKLNRSFHEWDTNDGNDTDLKTFELPFSSKLLRIFRQVFKLKDFRQNQLEAINATLTGHDTFVLMPTGGGKSLCYQLPACVGEGVTVVISPLKSLIYDQISKLKSLKIDVCHLSSDQDNRDRAEVMQNLKRNPCPYKLFYVTPERIGFNDSIYSIFETMNQNKTLARFVIDEAHCVSQWGHDFRPDYKKLVVLRQKFPDVPIMAVTATANPRVRVDVCAALALRDTKWFIQTFNRPNLKFEVRKKTKDTIDEMTELILTKFKYESGIVYCLTRNDCESTAAKLQSRYIKAKEYHAGLPDKSRQSIQDEWISGKTQVICATIAFGMGVDKPNVRFVFHYCVPKSMEGYYQEAGRAGRDGQLAHCYFYFCQQDAVRIRKLLDGEAKNNRNSGAREAYKVHLANLDHMTHYAYDVTKCRRIQLMKYLGEETNAQSLCPPDSRARCDNCESQVSYEVKDVTMDAKNVINFVVSASKDEESLKKTFTRNHLLQVMKGSEAQAVKNAMHHTSPYHGALKHYNKKDLENLIRTLVSGGYLQEKVKHYGTIANLYIIVGPNHRKLLAPRPTVRITIPVSSPTDPPPNNKRTSDSSDGASKKTRV